VTPFLYVLRGWSVLAHLWLAGHVPFISADRAHARAARMAPPPGVIEDIERGHRLP